MSQIVRVVDLFSGCGGLSLGFKTYKGPIKYEIVMALDNWKPAVKCYNDNYNLKESPVPISRLSDLTWFSHPNEVLLYYLVHYSLYKNDNQLLNDLKSIGIIDFLAAIYNADNMYIKKRLQLFDSDEFISEVGNIDKDVYKLALYTSFSTKLMLYPINKAEPDLSNLPWSSEYSVLVSDNDMTVNNEFNIINEIKDSIEQIWLDELKKLTEASLKEGHGQNAQNSKRVKSLIRFFKSNSGNRLKKLWVEWRSLRDSIRALYCMKVEKDINQLYSPKRKVHLVLGGPPCKGFSRIGRAVINNLREQGVHAWASNDFGDERNALMYKYVLFLEALKPDAFIFENVSNFQSTLKTPNGELDAPQLLSEAIDSLSGDNLHYNIKAKVINAKQYGIPQDRQRFIMLGINTKNMDNSITDKFFNIQTFDIEVPLKFALQGLDVPKQFPKYKPKDLVKAYTLVDESMDLPIKRFIKWIRQANPLTQKVPSYVDAHVYRKLREDDLGLVEMFAPGKRWMDYKVKKSDTLNKLDIFINKLIEYFKAKKDSDFEYMDLLKDISSKVNDGLILRLILENIDSNHHLLSNSYLGKGSGNHGDWFERLSANKVSKTIVAHIGKDTYGYFHPYESHSITIREAARIQTFPDFIKFGSAGIVDGYAMIGNAVPPLLSSIFASQLANLQITNKIFNNTEVDEVNIEQIEFSC